MWVLLTHELVINTSSFNSRAMDLGTTSAASRVWTHDLYLCFCEDTKLFVIVCTSRYLQQQKCSIFTVPTWRSQRPRSTVIPSSYCSKLIAGSICDTLKDFWMVWVGQDSCYGSLYVIECSLIDLIPEVGHTLVPLIWLLWSDHTQGESGEQSFCLAQWSR
jgi:hypothetical protein